MVVYAHVCVRDVRRGESVFSDPVMLAKIGRIEIKGALLSICIRFLGKASILRMILLPISVHQVNFL